MGLVLEVTIIKLFELHVLILQNTRVFWDHNL